MVAMPLVRLAEPYLFLKYFLGTYNGLCLKYKDTKMKKADIVLVLMNSREGDVCSCFSKPR